jgi:hypothetical protein
MDENEYLQKAKDLIQSGAVKSALDELKEAFAGVLANPAHGRANSHRNRPIGSRGFAAQKSPANHFLKIKRPNAEYAAFGVLVQQ